MEVATYISTYLVYPPNVSDDYLKGIPGHLIYNKKQYADLTFEKEFNDLVEPTGQIIKMTKRKYVDSFFETGSLQLGTLKYFQSIDDPEKGDKTEGSLIIVGGNDSQTAFVEISSGFNNYVFCCYDGEPNQEVISRFGYDDHFIIKDSTAFMNEISKVIGSTLAKRSKCLYKRDKVLIGQTEPDFNFNIVSSRLNDLVDKTKYFIKTENYKHQNEYRFMWEISNDVQAPLIIKCPNAIKYCERN